MRLIKCLFNSFYFANMLFISRIRGSKSVNFSFHFANKRIKLNICNLREIANKTVWNHNSVFLLYPEQRVGKRCFLFLLYLEYMVKCTFLLFCKQRNKGKDKVFSEPVGLMWNRQTKRKRRGVEGGFPAASVVRFLFFPVVCLTVRHGPRCWVQDAPGGTLCGMVCLSCFFALLIDRNKGFFHAAPRFCSSVSMMLLQNSM